MTEFKFPLPLSTYIALLSGLIIGTVVIFILLKDSNLYKFLLLTVFNLVSLGVFLSVLWLIVIGIPQLLSIVEQATLLPQKVKDYVYGDY